MLVISEFLPKLQEMQASRHRTTSASAIVEFLSTVSLEGVLPEVPPVVTRTFIVCGPVLRLVRKLTTKIVVRCIHYLVNISNMG